MLEWALDMSGFQRAYEAILAQPPDPSSERLLPQREVITYARLFADATGATDAYDTLLRDSPRLDTNQTIGDASRIYRVETEEAEGPAVALYLDFRSGNLMAGVGIVDVTGGEPSVAQVEALASRLLERADHARTSGLPYLSHQTLHLSLDPVNLGAQYYQWLDGEAIPAYRDTPEETAAYTEMMTRLEVRDSFYVWQRIPAGAAGSTDDTYYYGTVSRYASDDSAAASLDYLLESVRESGFVDVEPIPGAADLGDQSTGYTARIDWEYQDEPYTSWYRVHAIRVGPLVANVMFIAPELPAAGAVRPLAAAQSRCLETGSCTERALFPEDLTEDEISANEETQPSHAHRERSRNEGLSSRSARP